MSEEMEPVDLLNKAIIVLSFGSGDGETESRLIRLFNAAISDHFEDERYWIREGKASHRTCLEGSPIHIATVNLARTIVEGADE